jgi:AcrR family transcriptional regulator
MSGVEHKGRARVGRGAPGRSRVPRAVREREMLAAARTIFGERGYAATSMDDIAAASDITKPMLYAYFGTKEDLFARCVQAAGEELRASVRAAATPAEGARPDERLWAGLLAVFAGIEASRDAWDLLYPLEGGSPGGALGARAAYGVEAMAELVEALMADAAGAAGMAAPLVAETAPMARALTGAVMALVDWWRRHPEEPKELQALRAMNLAWRGLEGLLEERYWIPG